MDHVEQSLLGGGLASLEELRLRVPTDASAPLGLRGTLAALSRGAYPSLRGLWIMYPRRQSIFHHDGEGGMEVMWEDFGGALADAITSGHLSHLQELDISGMIWHQGMLIDRLRLVQ